jgi:Rrf2 family protein
MFPPRSRYALRALIQLARHAPETLTTEQIAEAAQVPAASLAKVLQSLNHANLVATHRGVGGGVSLRVAPTELSVLAIVEAVEPNGLLNCLSEAMYQDGTGAVNQCPSGKLDERLETVRLLHEQVLRETKLADLLDAGDMTGLQHPLDALLDRVRKAVAAAVPVDVSDAVADDAMRYPADGVHEIDANRQDTPPDRR